MDLYVANSGQNNRLFRNDGNLMFVDIAANAGVDDSGLSAGAAFGDTDGDGDLDLYVPKSEPKPTRESSTQQSSTK